MRAPTRTYVMIEGNSTESAICKKTGRWPTKSTPINHGPHSKENSVIKLIQMETKTKMSFNCQLSKIS